MSEVESESRATAAHPSRLIDSTLARAAAARLTHIGRVFTGPVRLIVVSAVLLILVIAAALAMLVVNSRERALADGKRELANTALILAEYVDRTFSSVRLAQGSVVQALADLHVRSPQEFAQAGTTKDIHILLTNAARAVANVSSAALVDVDGTVINHSGERAGRRFSIADRAHFQAIRSDPKRDFIISRAEIGRTSGTWSVAYLRKVRAPDGTVLGYVAAAIELDYFRQLFASLTLGKDSSVLLFRKDGTLLLRQPAIEGTVGQRYRVGELAEQGSTHGTLQFIGAMDHHRRVAAYHVTAGYPLIVAVGSNVDALLLQWRSEAIALITAAAIAALMIATMAAIIVRQFLRRQRSSEQRLRERESQLDTALNNMSQGLCMFGADERLVLRNSRYIQMYGLSPDVVRPGMTLRELIAHRASVSSFVGDVDGYCAMIVRSVREGNGAGMPIKTPDGRTINVVNQDTGDGGWVVTHEDITERVLAESERDRTRQFLDRVIDSVPVIISVKDAISRRYLLINRTAESTWKKARGLFLGKTIHDILPPETAAVIAASDDELLASEGLIHSELQMQTPTGERTFLSRRLVIPDGNGKPQYLLNVVEDVTERKLQEARILRLAHYDPLSELPNRTLFRRQLEQVLEQLRPAERAAVLYLDLDHFKTVNDTLGHPAGDELLKAAAGRLRTCLGEGDRIARLGGDEFAIIQPSVAELSDTTALVERIMDAIIEPFDLDGHRVVATVSVGIALAPDDGLEPDQLLKSADLALYGAKADGRGTYRFFEADMDARVKARRLLELGLRKAVELGQLELHYQPIVDVASGAISTCEALLRWRHPMKGMIAPVDFIPIAEETGLIVPIGDWVLRQACADAAAWPARVGVAVNISAVQLKNPSLIGSIVGALASSGIAAERLELEVTESVFIHNSEDALKTMHRLRALGVRVSLDDFGTGYSSLSYLRSFPFNKIKIDRSFIKDLPTRNEAQAIVQAVVGLAAKLDMKTTAEGVETHEQLMAVHALGCAEVQGYLFGLPQSAADVMRLLPARKASAQSAA